MFDQPDGGPTRMARHGDPTPACDLGDDFLGVEVHVLKVKMFEDLVVDAIDQHVAVVSLNLRGLEEQQAVLVFQLVIVGGGVKLPVLGEHQPLDGTLVTLAGQPFEIRLDRGAAIVRRFRVEVKVQNTCHGLS